MQTQAYLHDPLTGVYSRAMLNVRLAEELERANRYVEPFSLLLIDIDHFKNVNDAFGHTRGDQVLVEFARLVSAKIRSADSVFRFGGDEFVILLPNTDKDNASTSAQRLLEQIRAVPFSSKPPLYISISIGLSTYPQDASTAEGLFEVADLRHQLAKRRGRNQIVSQPDALLVKPAMASPSRLIERDMALVTLNQFFESLAEQHRSVMRVTGREGVGKSRLLDTFRKIARLRGFAVLAITGRPPLKNRTFAALFDSQAQLPDFQFNFEQENPAAALQNYLAEKGQAGLVITVDDLTNIDRSTFAWIRELFYSADLNELGIIYANGTTANLRNFPYNISLQEVIHLDPLTPAGVRIWLRQSLQWEAPPEFVNWLHIESGGLPRRIAQVLQFLIKQHVINRKGDAWEYRDALTRMSTAEYVPIHLDSPPTNIPAPLIEMIDRTQEIFELKNLVIEHQLVTLCGPGGSGKTTLACQAATELLDSFLDGVFQVSLQQLEDPAGLLGALLIPIGLPVDRPAIPVEELGTYLGAKKILFVLDDYPASFAAPEPLLKLSKLAPSIHFLFLAHQPLEFQGEISLTLKGLAVPPAVGDDLAEKWPAAALFLQAARRVKNDFQFTERNSPWMVQICGLVQGLPLSVEIAAAWSQTIECEDIAARVASSQATRSQLPPRTSLAESTVEIVLDAFWDLFSAADQLILCRLTVFPASFRRDIAQQVSGASPFFLDALTAKAYLVKTATGAYLMPHILVEYLREKSRPFAAEIAHTHTRFVEVYAREIADLQENLEGTGQRKTFNQLQDEHANIQAAWHWAVENQLHPSIHILARALGIFYRFLGAYQRGYDTFIAAVQKLKVVPSLPELDFVPVRTSVGILLSLAGEFAFLSGDRQRGLEFFQEGVEHLESVPNQAFLAEALLSLADIHKISGDRQKQQAALQKSLQLYQQLDDENGFCRVENRLGVLAANSGHPTEARNYFETVRQTAVSLEDQAYVARSLNNLALLAYYEDDLDSARVYLTESLQLARNLDAPLLTASILDSLGKLEYKLGDYHQSALNFREALQLARELHAQTLILEVLVSIASLWTEVDRTAAALPLLRTAAEHPACPYDEKQRAIMLIERLDPGHTSPINPASLPGSSYALYSIVDDLLATSASTHILEN